MDQGSLLWKTETETKFPPPSEKLKIILRFTSKSGDKTSFMLPSFSMKKELGYDEQSLTSGVHNSSPLGIRQMSDKTLNGIIQRYSFTVGGATERDLFEVLTLSGPKKIVDFLLYVELMEKLWKDQVFCNSHILERCTIRESHYDMTREVSTFLQSEVVIHERIPHHFGRVSRFEEAWKTEDVGNLISNHVLPIVIHAMNNYVSSLDNSMSCVTWDRCKKDLAITFSHSSQAKKAAVDQKCFVLTLFPNLVHNSHVKPIFKGSVTFLTSRQVLEIIILGCESHERAIRKHAKHMWTMVHSIQFFAMLYCFGHKSVQQASAVYQNRVKKLIDTL